jgi:hypothetical protein
LDSSKNEFLEEEFKDLRDKFLKEHENQYVDAEKLLNNDMYSQEANFKASLKKKLERQKVKLIKLKKFCTNYKIIFNL